MKRRRPVWSTFHPWNHPWPHTWPCPIIIVLVTLPHSAGSLLYSWKKKQLQASIASALSSITMLQTYQAVSLAELGKNMPSDSPMVPLINKVRITTDHILHVSQRGELVLPFPAGTLADDSPLPTVLQVTQLAVHLPQCHEQRLVQPLFPCSEERRRTPSPWCES